MHGDSGALPGTRGLVEPGDASREAIADDPHQRSYRERVAGAAGSTDTDSGGCLQDLVVEPGDRVSATGRFVRFPDGDWLDLAQTHDLVLRNRPRKSTRSVRLDGIDADEVLRAARSGPSVMPGCVRVIGVWQEDSIAVEQHFPVPWPAHSVKPKFGLPPPAGGWDTIARSTEVVGLDQLRASGAIVRDQWLREEGGALILRVAAGDVEAVERVLAVQLPRRLCVVRSRYTAAQLDEVRDMFDAHHGTWGFEAWDYQGMTARCQPRARALLTRVSTGLAEWADTLPDGLLTVHPAMTPA